MLLRIIKKVIEGITAAGAVLLPAGSHPLCVVAGIILLLAYMLEVELWEGGT